MINDKFTQIYLNSLNIIKQSEDEDKELNNECGDVNSNDEVISDDVDEEQADDVEVSDDEIQDDDAQIEDSEDDEDLEDEGEKQEQAGTCFCFKTTNQTLIDAINSGFEKAVFTVKAKDDEGNDTTTEVEFTADDFVDFGECDCDDEQEDEIPDEDLPEDQTDEIPEDEEFGDVEEGQGSDDEEDTTFESVFKKYYGSLINEEDEGQTSDGQTLEEEADDDSFTDNKNVTNLQGTPKPVGGKDDVCPACGEKPCVCEQEEQIEECGDVCPECGEKKCTCEAVEEKKDKITKKTVKSAQEVQKLIEKDFGKKSKPWDLKQVKKVAFKNGKLFAASNNGKDWYNKQNKKIDL